MTRLLLPQLIWLFIMLHAISDCGLRVMLGENRVQLLYVLHKAHALNRIDSTHQATEAFPELKSEKFQERFSSLILDLLLVQRGLE